MTRPDDRAVGILPSGGPGATPGLSHLGADILSGAVAAAPHARTVLLAVTPVPAGAVTAEYADRPAPFTVGSADTGALGRMARRLPVLAAVTVGPAAPEVLALADGLRARGVPVEWVDLEESGLLVLADRVHRPAQLEGRLDYLRLAGLVPAGGYALIDPDRAVIGSDVAAEGWARRCGLEACRLDGAFSHTMSGLDLAAAVAGAECVVTGRHSTADLALGFGRPVVVVHAGTDRAAGPGVVAVGGADDLMALEATVPPAPAAAEIHARTRSARARLDETVARLTLAVAGDPPTVEDELVGLRERVEALEAVNGALRSALAEQRLRLANPAGAAVAPRPGRPARDGSSERATAEEVQRLREELDRVYATKTMRALAPVRRLYGRVRSEQR